MNLKKLKKVFCLALSAFMLFGEAGNVTTLAAETEIAQEQTVEETETAAEETTEVTEETTAEEATEVIEEVEETATEEATEEVEETETEEATEEVEETETEETTEAEASEKTTKKEVETEEVTEDIEVTTAAPAVTGLKQIHNSSTSVQVQWNATGARYTVEWSTDSKNWITSTTSSTSTQDYIFNLTAGKKYYVRVYANADKTSAATICVYTAPNAGTTSIKQVNDDTSTTGTTVKWNKVGGANGYKVEYRPQISGSSTITKYTTTNSIKLKDLKKNTGYYIYVYAYTGGNDYKAVSGNYGYETIKLKPTKVSGVRCNTFWLYSGALIKFNQIEKANGYEYKIYKYNKDSKKCDKKVESGKTSSTSVYTSEKVAPGQFYTVKVRAYTTINNKNVYGKWSDEIYFTGDPKNIKVSNSSASSQKISWSGVKGATNYTVYVSKEKGSRGKKVGTTSKKSITCSKYGKDKLKKGKTYYYTVVANKKVGDKTYKSTSSYQYYLKK